MEIYELKQYYVGGWRVEEKGKKKPEFVPEAVKEIREKKEKEMKEEKPKDIILKAEEVKEIVGKVDEKKDGEKEIKKEVQKPPKFIITDPNAITKKDVEEFKTNLDKMMDSKEHPMTVPSIEYFRALALLPVEKRPKVMPVRMKRVRLNKLLREKPKTLPDDPKHPLPRKKVAIVGFAETSRMEAPFNDPTYEVWGLNELYLAIPRADRWFEIHAENNIKNSFRDPRHWEWLKGCQIPVYMTKKYKEIKACKVYPIELMIKEFGPIYSSSIAEMLALAIYEGFTEISLFGVDMALTKEYGSQKSGVEYLLGVAVGLGIKTYIPMTSDLMKVGFQYGYDDPSEFAIKMKIKNVELLKKKAGAEQAIQQTN
ncbi:hypothetical protein LCGC14_2918750, partial [marine sediment metagenome]